MKPVNAFKYYTYLVLDFVLLFGLLKCYICYYKIFSAHL